MQQYRIDDFVTKTLVYPIDSLFPVAEAYQQRNNPSLWNVKLQTSNNDIPHNVNVDLPTKGRAVMAAVQAVYEQTST